MTKIEQLEARIIELEDALGLNLWPEPSLRFGPRQRKFAALLAKRRYVPHETLVLALGDDTEPHTIRYLARNVRRKLAPFGIEVNADYGLGYYVPENQWPTLRDMFSVRRSVETRRRDPSSPVFESRACA